MPGPLVPSSGSCGGEPDIVKGLWESLEDKEKREEKGGGGRRIGKAGPLFLKKRESWEMI